VLVHHTCISLYYTATGIYTVAAEMKPGDCF
jgi:hypothetical protein